MIEFAVRHGLETSERQRYDSALAGVWGDLSRTLARLEALAAEPDDLDDEALAVLPGLQYALHRAGELTAGIDPPPGEEESHAELAAALADARDTTGDVADALEAGGQPSVALLVHEWRGSLFRVRLARHRLQTMPPAPETASADPAPTRAALFSTALVVGGVITFTAGAMLTLWPLWALGLVLVAGGFFVYRP
jgi:hypothetical protein